MFVIEWEWILPLLVIWAACVDIYKNWQQKNKQWKILIINQYLRLLTHYFSYESYRIGIKLGMIWSKEFGVRIVLVVNIMLIL